MPSKIKVINMVPASLSNETSHDREPNITVNPSNFNQIVGTAFTPDPAGSANAPVYVSNDGGETWMLNSIVPGGISGSSIGTADITIRYSSKAFYASDIRLGNFKMDVARTLDPFSPLPMTSLKQKNSFSDQPFIETMTVPNGTDVGKDRVYVGNNDFGAPSGKTATVDLSMDAMGAATFNSIRIEKRPTGGQNGPSIRTAIHKDGTVYAVFFGWRSLVAFPNITSDVVVVRDDAWGEGANPFTSLVDPIDSVAGMRVVIGRTIIWNQLLGQQRTGSQLTIAVDPNNSSTLYIAWCDQQAGGYTLHVRRSTDRGLTWSQTDLLMVENATNPALSINENGKIGLLYQQLTGLVAAQRWETHFRQSKDGMKWEDFILSTSPSNQPIAFNYIGDYAYLTSFGQDFYGIFSANNTPDMANFPQGVKYQRNADFTTHQLHGLGGTTNVSVSIDPFFFKVTEEANDKGTIEKKKDCSCSVELPDTPQECISPAAPPWLPFSQCIIWYETRYVRFENIIYRIIYEHRVCMMGRQQGGLLFTMTLLPGESLKLYHYDRYRRTRSATDLYSVHTSFRSSVAAIHQSRVAQSTSKYQSFIHDARTDGDTNITLGGLLFPVGWSLDDIDSASIHFSQSASAQSASEDFNQTITAASQQVDTERSIVISTFEDKETRDVTVREIKNPNDCRAVTYFVRRVNEVYQLSTMVSSVSYALLRDKTHLAINGSEVPWRSIDDFQGVEGTLRKIILESLQQLPKVGEVVEAPRPVTLPTDGVIYEPELAHCSSCEPERVAAEEIALEKAKAEENKTCLEAELVALEVKRRQLLLEKGILDPFELAPNSNAPSTSSGQP
jgi:hypothetical protein